MKKSLFAFAAVAVCAITMSFVQVMPNGDLRIGTGATALYQDQLGRFGQMLNWDFNPNHTTKGLSMEYGVSESSGLYMDGDYTILWSPGDFDRLLRIYDEDYLYSGSTTYEKAYIDGVGNYFKASDERRKTDIAVVSDPVSKLKKIKGVSYKYKEASEENSLTERPGQKIPNKKTAGLIAQDVEAVIPEAVQTDEFGNKFLDYDALIPYLVEAVKAQQAEIEALKAEAKSKK